MTDNVKDNIDHLAVVLMNVVVMNQLDTKTLGILDELLDKLDCDITYKNVAKRAIQISMQHALQSQTEAELVVHKIEKAIGEQAKEQL